MAVYLPLRGRAPVLRGRGSECGALDRLIEAVRAGASRVLVVCGEPGGGQDSAAGLPGRARAGGRGAGPVGLVFAARDPGEELAGLPQMTVQGLRERDARALLDSVLTGPLDARVRDRIIAETRGNPLALLELPWGLTPEQLAVGFRLPSRMPLPGRIEGRVGKQLGALSAPTQPPGMLAAARPTSSPPPPS